MELARTDYLPDPALDADAMAAMQRDIAADAVFADDHGLAPESLRLDDPIADTDPAQTALGGDGPVVVGVDQAFREDEAVSVAVALRGERVVERAVGRAPLEIPYIPGLLAFREGGAIVDALRSLSVAPDLLVLDGSGRIHYREAGIATHVGVLFDVPTVGVAKNLLCGTPVSDVEERYLDAGERVAVEADDEVETCANGTTIGHFYQSRQYENPTRRHVNPLVVSPGHRVATGTATALVAATCAGYKLPEPTRLADGAVGDVTR
ncbi:deoxyribonuclease V [Halarchaeum rubridurum]|uniref:Endonuclease V n=1 Tax=Halarchaeum rubridurum TaxID=489911 RepID=A0A830G1N4_9EURY|nr:endonuclease V [Halarchaeum rubridurum]MBP1955265.1 deoxyribonuclease V [Halarchaeum rubridurum]GGM70797.1 endonuclease V [Halarchaeum rubridurum]